ncbi:hypothetical protein P1X14_03970 [Sphingomonas sp. AOB5]|uniref:hypothetical protein n=1 Tax=Sphingomonas sp. AOB5 TaxID=3034017 RepID=UPI0023F83978|nr:hypothetical protein [Sphingomonas sp. AOB5]MDF7774393.1 hypothetical protein [Sphingomonas sp. AOB5]
MYLYDRVAQSRPEPGVVDAIGNVHHVPGAADVAAEVRRCSARYVLDDTIRDTCLELLCNRPETIQPRDDCYRIPHQTMWIEWTDPCVAKASGSSSQRAGLFVEADETGRRGSMQSYSQDAEGNPWAAQMLFLFDFDEEIASDGARCGVHFDDVANPDELHRILRHGLGRIDQRWADYFRASGGLTHGDLQTMMRATLPDFGILCAFLLLLSLECSVAEPRQGLEKINRARAKAGKALLLDHVEVSLRLAAVGSGGGAGRGHGDRSASRLHQVRGHLVRRAGKTFWRSHHLRGDVGVGVIASRTVRVTGSGEALRRRLG